VTTPKDLVIVIDKSHSMTQRTGKGNTRLWYASKAAQAVILSANPNDHVSPNKITADIYLLDVGSFGNFQARCQEFACITGFKKVRGW